MSDQETRPAEECKEILDEKQLENVSGGEKWMTEEEFINEAKKAAQWVSEEHDPLKFIRDNY